MGSFNIVCAVSGLPCTPGDKVYAMLLTRVSIGCSRDVYSNSLWAPRTPALLATYADYGNVEFSDEPAEQVLQAIACRMLDIEAVETGDPRVGAHVRHGAGLDAYFAAATDDLLTVTCEEWRSVREMNARLEKDWVESGFTNPDPPEPVIGPIPAVGSVVAVLEAAGLHANNPAETSFTVNEIERGEVMVTCTSWSGLKIADAAKAIEDHGGYVGIVCRGRGHSEHDNVLRVFPKPKAEGWVGPGHHWDREAPKDCTLAVVRCDVWDALLKLEVCRWRGDARGVDRSRCTADEKVLRAIVVDYIRAEQEDEDGRPVELRRALRRGSIEMATNSSENMVTGHLGPHASMSDGGSGSPGVTGWSQHYEAWAAMLAANDPYAFDTAEQVGQRFADGVLVYRHLSSRWLRLMPSQYAGTDELWAEQAAFHRAIAGIADAENAKQEHEDP